MSTTAIASPATRRLTRAGAVVGTAVAVGLIFAVTQAFGVDYVITDPGPNQPPHAFGVLEIGVLSAIVVLLGWGTLALSERLFRRYGRRIWMIVGASVFVLSYVPLAIEVATTPTKIMLAILHLVVAAGAFTMVRRHNAG